MHIEGKKTRKWAGILRDAAQNSQPVSGLTHNFYKYPARFSPIFASTAIELFSKPGDLILDPYMGGGTTVVEALAMGRDVVGNDLNSLASFITRVKTTPMTKSEVTAIQYWSEEIIPQLKYDIPYSDIEYLMDEVKTRNLNLTRARYIKKIIAVSIHNLDYLPTKNSKNFVRCAILRAGQTVLDGRKRCTSVTEFRQLLNKVISKMIKGMYEFITHLEKQYKSKRIIINRDAVDIPATPIFNKHKRKVNLVVTSPPYPGVHVLYHRWQVDGRKETPSPFWIAACNDGKASSYYNFGGRKEVGLDTYFTNSLRTLKAIREVMNENGVFIQMIAFNDPESYLPRYLQNMHDAGFSEIIPSIGRIWREVPSRRWHATAKGRLASSLELVLVHIAS